MICIANNCERITHAKQLCSMHYQRFKKYGGLETKFRPGNGRKYIEKNCSVFSCKNKYLCMGYCQTHYIKSKGIQDEILRKQRISRKKNNNLHVKRYEKTKRGFLMRTYRNMKSRIGGIQKQKAHLYKDKELLDKYIFYDWALENPVFNQLFTDWESSGYLRTLTPSINRIDTSRGYLLNNIEWLTHSENSRLGAINGPRTLDETFK